MSTVSLNRRCTSAVIISERLSRHQTLGAMASLYKRSNGYYYLAFFDATRRPKRKQVALKTTKKRRAERLRVRLEDEHARGDYDPWTDADFSGAGREETNSLEQLSDAVAAFLASRSHLSPYTVERYRSVLHNLTGVVEGQRLVCDIRASDLLRYLDATEANVVTRRSYARAMRAFFNWLIAREVVKSNPVDDLGLERAPSKHPRFLSPEDVESICRAIDASDARPKVTPGTSRWLLPIVRANVYLGLRAGELVNVRWEHVDLDGRSLLVANTDAFTTKGGRERVLPLAAAPLKVISELERRSEWVFPNYGGTRLHRLYLSRRFKHFARRAGLSEAINFHATRHTAASWLAQQGASVEAIRRYMGHSSIAVTQKYMHLSPDGFAAQIERALDGISAGGQ